MNFPTFEYETKKLSQGFLVIAGCDEVGRGPLAGPVVAASVVFDPNTIEEEKWWGRIRDSKLVPEKEREELAKLIKEKAFDFAVGIVSHETIDEINIHQAGLLAMKKSVEGLKELPNFLFLDGRHTINGLDVKQEAVIGGDGKILSIAAASIIAKVARDEIMAEWHAKHPEYGFDKHKGYATKQHKAAIAKFGLLPIHRKTFCL